ncbi:phage terminase large subunit [Heliophilum fasciatum]|uniref:Putative phage terminase large subunit-like protein n=1 Tax=Heliophilum fasciatum TaxID=35700 RepID=A0A4R2RF76_9FIRM|nr:phage terminase large subunit [Heliophilum fasciatum]MCW2279098.1 putative phage terminase large subunit-like protein [Heliophilum fasciatum]TCP61274.1 putative phage terminase large subunit-like protein [Heliophilum fasciatum]
MELLESRTKLLDDVREKQELTIPQREMYVSDLKELYRLRRIDRSEFDVLYFMYEYFSDDKNPENEQNLIPAGTSIDDAPRFHKELCDLLRIVSVANPTARIAWAAPRGHAKSAYLSNGFPLHEIVFDKRKYILIISETDSMAKKFIEWISLQLKFNKKLREDYGELLSDRKALNEKDNQEAFLTKSGVLVEAASMGKQLRGKRNGSHRPDLVIMDDLESARNTNTPELRDKNQHWFNSVVMSIGDPSRTAFIYMGTIVNARGLLPSVLQRSDFESRTYSAIVSPPERGDLWEQFETFCRNPESETRLDDALAHYEANREEMDAGVEVLWPGRFSYARLMIEKVNIGSRAFGSEYLNNPIDEETQIFKPSMFTFFDYPELRDKMGRPIPLDYYGAWDIAMGKNDRSDYNAIVVIGRDRRTGILYVVETWARKCPAHEALNEVMRKMANYRPRIFAIESVQAQFDLFRQARERMALQGIYLTKLKPVISKTKKEERIESLEPVIEQGVLRFMKHQRILLEQLEQFPNHDHDDLPDALQMAVELCGGGRRRVFHQKPAGL